MQGDEPSLRTVKPNATVDPAPLVACLDTWSDAALQAWGAAGAVVVVLVDDVLVVEATVVLVVLVVVGPLVVVVSEAAGLELQAARTRPAATTPRTADSREGRADLGTAPRLVTDQCRSGEQPA